MTKTRVRACGSLDRLTSWIARGGGGGGGGVRGQVRDMGSGAVVGNVQGSECFAYGSAVVDPVLQRAWVFGSERDLCHRDEDSRCAAFWQGRAKAGNGVRAEARHSLSRFGGQPGGRLPQAP